MTMSVLINAVASGPEPAPAAAWECHDLLLKYRYRIAAPTRRATDPSGRHLRMMARTSERDSRLTTETNMRAQSIPAPRSRTRALRLIASPRRREHHIA